MVSPRYKTRLFHGPWRDPVRVHRNQHIWGAMWDMEHSPAMVSLHIYKTMQMTKRHKVWYKKQVPKSIGTLTVLRCILGCKLGNLGFNRWWLIARTSSQWGKFCLFKFHLTLTHWGRDKMDAISQTMFSNAFSWIKIYEFCLRFHWSLFLGVQLTIFHHWFR